MHMSPRRNRVKLDLSMEEAAHLCRVLVAGAGWLPQHRQAIHMDIFRDVVHHADPAVRRSLDSAMKEQFDVWDETRDHTRECPERGNLQGEQVAYIVRLLTQATITAATGPEAELHRSTYDKWTEGIDFGDPDMVDDAFISQGHYADALDRLKSLRSDK